MKKVIKASGNTKSTRKQAEEVLNHLKEAFGIIEEMGDKAHLYIADHISDDLDIMIREIDSDLRL